MVSSLIAWSAAVAAMALGLPAHAEQAARPEVKTFTALTGELELSQGEVTNTFHKLKIPTGPIAVYRFVADVVEKDADGNVIPVPIFDAYLHHEVVGSNHEAYDEEKTKWGPMKPSAFSRSVGFGAGTESRGTPQEFYYPYAFATIEGEDEWIANVHVINTRKLPTETAHHCLECPCTSEDVFTEDAVNGLKFAIEDCNAELRYENNTVCSVETYHGGLRCCEHGEFCLEHSELSKEDGKATYYLRYTISYSEIVPEIRPLYLASCCDASGDMDHYGNIEYDIPVCDPEIHPGCVHTLSTRQRLDRDGASLFSFRQSRGALPAPDREVELVFAVGHQHRGGMGISIYNDATGKLVCSSVPQYGTGDEVGNEKDYVIAMTPCSFDPPVRMRASDVIRVVALYNNTLPHTGAMSLMYLAVSDVGTDSVELSAIARAHRAGSFWAYPAVFAGAAVGTLALALIVVKRVKQRRGYTQLARPN